MKSEVTLTIKLRFDHDAKMTELHKIQVRDTVETALNYWRENAGICPDDIRGFTDLVEVDLPNVKGELS